jgi:hypothetical protein
MRDACRQIRRPNRVLPDPVQERQGLRDLAEEAIVDVKATLPGMVE